MVKGQKATEMTLDVKNCEPHNAILVDFRDLTRDFPLDLLNTRSAVWPRSCIPDLQIGTNTIAF